MKYMNQKQLRIPFTMAFFLFAIIAYTQTEMHRISEANPWEVVSGEQALSELAARDRCLSQAKEMRQWRGTRKH